MAADINLDAIKNEIIRYGNANPLALQPAVLSKDLVLNKLNPTKIGKVKGKWSIPHILTGHVVQAFSDKWTPFGMIQFQKKVARDFHQKVNFPIFPYKVYGTWLEDLYEEDKKPADMPFSKWIMGNVVPKAVVKDLNILSVTGVYDPAEVGSENPTFGKSMDGINIIVDRMVADTVDPVFYIPVDAALANNIVDRVTKFELGLPENSTADTLVVSITEFNNYVAERETPSDKYIDFKDPQRGKTKFGRNLVGIPGRKSGQIISWEDGNFLRLYDRKDNPATLDDVQVQDYMVKLFAQFHLGYDFAINQMVYVETANAAKKRGLNNATQNDLYFPNETLTV